MNPNKSSANGFSFSCWWLWIFQREVSKVVEIGRIPHTPGRCKVVLERCQAQLGLARSVWDLHYIHMTHTHIYIYTQYPKLNMESWRYIKHYQLFFKIILLQTTSATSNSVTGVSSWIVIHGPQWSAPPRSRPLGWKWAAWRRDGGSSRTAYVWNNDQCGYHVSCLTLWALGDAPRAGHVQYQPRKERLFPSQALEKSRLQSTCVKICGEYSWVYSSNLWISTYFIYLHILFG